MSQPAKKLGAPSVLSRRGNHAFQVNQAGLLGVAARASVAALLLLPSTLAIGASFPFAVRALSESAAEAAATSARVYAWNTLGAIVGSAVTGFVLLPVAGLWLTFTLLAVTSLRRTGCCRSFLRSWPA